MFQQANKQYEDNRGDEFVIFCTERLKNDTKFIKKFSNYDKNELLKENINEDMYFRICQKVENLDVDELSPQYRLVLYNISHISFNRLTQLDLNNCGIQNIQSITWLYSPNLMALNLSGNYIRQLNSLNHCNYKKLCNIQIQSKGISNFFISNLSRMKINEQIILIHLNNETVISSSSSTKFPNYLRPILKIESPKIQRLEFQITKDQYQVHRYYFNKIDQDFMDKRGIKIFQIFKEQNKIINYRSKKQKQ